MNATASSSVRSLETVKQKQFTKFIGSLVTVPWVLHRSMFGTTGLRMVTSVESNEHSGRPSTCRNDVIIEERQTLTMANCHLTVREIGDELGISKDSDHAILMQDLGMCRVSAKLLSKEQKQVHLETVQDFFKLQMTIPNTWTLW